MTTTRMGPAYVDGTRVLAGYVASYDASKWVCVVTEYTGLASEAQLPNGYDVMEVTQGAKTVVLRTGLDADTAHSFARLQAESLMEGRQLVSDLTDQV